MRDQGFTINIMTAELRPGDAIGNYILTSARLWRSWGVNVVIYADHISPVYGPLARPSSWYTPDGTSLLWYHYSIYTDNLSLALESPDYKIFDFHGVAPARLFAGQDPYLESLCLKGQEALPTLADYFDLYVVHSEYSRAELINNGFNGGKIHKLPLVVDTKRLVETNDKSLTMLLSQLKYILFVGRIIPQKDILAMLEIFSHVLEQKPDMVLILAGTRHLAPRYQQQIDRTIKQKKLDRRVIMTGQVDDPGVLASLFANAFGLLVTSEWESFCVPVVEAMYFGTPVIAHDVPPLPEVTGKGGIIINKNQPRMAANAIINLLPDKDHYRSLKRSALEQSTKFTDRSLSIELLTFLRVHFVSI